MIKLNLKVGRFPLQIEFKEMKQLHKFNAVYGNLPQKCDACGSDNLILSFKNPGGNDYYTLQCGDCTADANFGIHNNESKNLYWKREKMTIYIPPENNNGQGQGSQPHNEQPGGIMPPVEDQEVSF